MTAPPATGIRVQTISRGGVSYLRLYGTLDETFSPSVLGAEALGQDVLLNLKEVRRFTSFGVREWVRTLDELGKKQGRIFLVACSPTVVTQLNQIGNFAGKARIVSVQLPLACPRCAWDTETEAELSRPNQALVETAQATRCQRCGTAMELDDLPEVYLGFRDGRAEEPLDEATLTFLRNFEKNLPRTGPAPVGTAVAPPVEHTGSASIRIKLPKVLTKPVVWVSAGGGLLALAVSLLTISLHRPGEAAGTGRVERVEKSVADLYRDRLFDDFKHKRFGEAASAGESLEGIVPLDAEETWTLAEAERRAGDDRKATDHYAAFQKAMEEKDPKDPRIAQAAKRLAETTTASEVATAASPPPTPEPTRTTVARATHTPRAHATPRPSRTRVARAAVSNTPSGTPPPADPPKVATKASTGVFAGASPGKSVRVLSNYLGEVRGAVVSVSEQQLVVETAAAERFTLPADDVLEFEVLGN